MSLREAALAVIDQYVVTDPDRTLCLCCLASALTPAVLTQHREHCRIGALGEAVQQDVIAMALPTGAASV